MANLAYSNDVQNQVAYLLFRSAYSSISSSAQLMIDGNSSVDPPTAGVAQRAYRTVQQMAQWWELSGSTNTTDNAEAWLVHEIAYLASITLRPERTAELRVQREEARRAYLDSITTTEITTGYDANVFTPTMQSLRYYVLQHTVNKDKPVLIPPEVIDSATFWCNNWLWNKTKWTFRRRKLSARLNVVSVTGATFEESTLTLTLSSGFADYPRPSAGVTDHTAGSIFVVTDGTSAIKMTALVTEKASNSVIVLGQSISEIADDLSAGDVDGYLLTVNVFGLQSGDRLDAISTRKLYVQGENACVEWGTADQIAYRSSVDQTDVGVPRRFRVERQGQTLVWHFWPIPDANYTFQFDGCLMLPGSSTPGVPTTATDTIPFSKYPQEFKSVLKDLVLGKVLRDRNKDDDAVWRAAMDEVERIAPLYDDPGEPTGDGEIRDVYGDSRDLGGNDPFWMGVDTIGGPM